MDIKKFKLWNKVTALAVLAISAFTYLSTIEPTASFWDCGEFIASSYKLEVGHPPGNPVFQLIARFFTMFTGPDKAAVMVNSMSAVCSALTIFFLYLTIVFLVKRVIVPKRDGEGGTGEYSLGQAIAIYGSGAVGALAYCFSDTFWFSAVEGEVYAMSSLFTAMVVWAMTKWYEETDRRYANRWIVLISFLMGLSIGVHLLNLLAIPMLVYMYYFKMREDKPYSFWEYVKILAVSVVILAFILFFMVPYIPKIAAYFDLFFVNTLGLPYNTGAAFFIVALLTACFWGLFKTLKTERVFWNTALLCFTTIVIGFSVFIIVIIRSCAKTPTNEYQPDNAFTLVRYLSREQYGSTPLLYGQYYGAPYELEQKSYWAPLDGKYKKAPSPVDVKYDRAGKMLFPRMYSNDERHIKFYESYTNGKGTPVPGAQYKKPTQGANLSYFFDFQLGWMYWRYFMWNFVGRQSDIQPSRTTITDGNWLSGIRWIDEKYVGPQDNLPREIAENKGRNTYYFLPFLLGLIGLVYQLNRDQRNFSIVLWLFVMMGIALVFYFNTSPGEPRERDYVYAGSFYAFSIWIGFGVLALRDLIARLSKRDNVATAAAATVVAMSVPAILAAQNWDDHDRSHRTMARDIGWNYLQSTLPNSIILNYGDNDTFPLWNNQEVYGVRPDVRIMNTSYLGGEWYIDEMKTKANDAPGVPFSLPKHKYTFNNDMIYVTNSIDRPVEIKEVIDFVRSDDPRSKVKLADGTLADYIPAKRIALPVNKENALASGIVAEKDRDKMVDTVFINIKKNSLDKNQLMILDMLANFDWKRPIYMTQVYILQDFGLMDYLQFDGYAYRLVPILTPTQNPYEIGRIDADYAAPLLRDTFRYGNLEDPRVYADYFIQYNLSASHARDAFARVAKELLRQNRVAEAVELLDLGLERMPTSQVRFTDTNTYPFLEAYYAASAMGDKEAAAKGDALLREYAQTLIEYIEHYLRFEGAQGDMVSGLIDEKLDQLGDIYYLASYADRKEVVAELNDYYRSLGVSEENLIDVGDKRQQPDSALLPAAK